MWSRCRRAISSDSERADFARVAHCKLTDFAAVVVVAVVVVVVVEEWARASCSPSRCSSRVRRRSGA